MAFLSNLEAEEIEWKRKLVLNKAFVLFCSVNYPPMYGAPPDKESFIQNEIDYKNFYDGSNGFDGDIKLKEPDFDNCLKKYQENYQKWKDGGTQILSFPILLNYEHIKLIEELEQSKTFVKWETDLELINRLKDFVKEYEKLLS